MKRDTVIIIMIAFVAVAVGTIIFLSGRANFSDASPSVVYKAGPAIVIVPFTEITHGSKSTVATRVNYIINSESQLHELWEMIDATSTPPVIDFKMYAVMAIFAGEQSISGSAITVSKIEDSIARVVSITIAKPEGNCAQKHSITTPYKIIKVPATSLNLSHEDILATTSCNM